MRKLPPLTNDQKEEKKRRNRERFNAYYSTHKQHYKRYRELNREILDKKRRVYYAKNKERIIAKEKVRRESKRDEILAKKRASYLANREKHNASARRYQLQHPEVHKRANATYRKNNLDKIRLHNKEKARQFRRDHRERANLICLHHNNRRRALKLGSQVNPDDIRAWMKEVRSKPFMRCHWCGTKVHGRQIHFDHVIALTKGGPHTIGNLCCSCGDCNRHKSSKLIADWICQGQTFLSL